MKPFIELITFKTKNGVTPEQVVKATEEAYAFSINQEGILSREPCRKDDGTWHDILFWESQGQIIAAMLDTPDSTHRFALFSLADAESDGVLLFSSLMSVSFGDLVRVSSMLSCKRSNNNLGGTDQKPLFPSDSPSLSENELARHFLDLTES